MKYQAFAVALDVACRKVDEYYEKTTESPAYIMSMSTNLILFIDETIANTFSSSQS